MRQPESAAGLDKPGIATMRVNTYYDTRGPHEPVRIFTEPNAGDLDMRVEDIKLLRQRVDVVILVFHSGVIRVPRVVSDFPVTLAHAAIDAGADLVVAHGSHIPKAIEVYKGKAVFYSLGAYGCTGKTPCDLQSSSMAAQADRGFAGSVYRVKRRRNIEIHKKTGAASPVFGGYP